MNAQAPDRREGSDDVTVEGNRIRAGFRLVTTEPLAGGPVELEFFVENPDRSPLYLAVGGDRMHRRPGQFEFVATIGGEPIADPMAGVANLGGPLGAVQVTNESPWFQRLVLNQFLALETAIEHVTAGASGRLELICRRPLTIASTAAEAIANRQWPTLTIELAFDLRRDDGALATLVEDLFDQVRHGPRSSRERPLELLFALRMVVHKQIVELSRDTDPSVADRAKQALGISN